MSTTQSTLRRIEAENDYDGWLPAGPALDPNAPPVGSEVPLEALGVAAGEVTATTARLGVPNDDLPSVAHMVVFHLREGEVRNRRTNFPAVVMESDRETRRLKLWVIVDDGDTWVQESVPELAGSEQGWVPVVPSGANLVERFQRLVDQIFGENYLEPETSLMALITERDAKIAWLEAKIDGMEAAIEAYGGRLDEINPSAGRTAIAPVKRGPGRPPKPRG